MTDPNRFITEKAIMPWEVPPEMGWPDMTEIGQDVHANVRDTLQRAPEKQPVVQQKSFDKTLQDFLDELKTSKDPSAQRKAEIIDTELLFLSRYYTVDTNLVVIRKLGANEVGKSENGIQYLDPCLFNNKAFTEDEFAEKRMETLAHELTHEKFNLDHEGLTDLRAAMITGKGSEDYEDDVHNTAIITDTIGKGDKEKGCLRTIELYTTGRYDELFDEFATAYAEKHPDKVASNPDVALKIFQLAFPKLKVDKEGALAVDREMIEDVSGTYGDEDSEGEVEQSYAMAA